MEIERIDIKKLDRLACTNVPCSVCGLNFNANRGYIWVREKEGKYSILRQRVCYDCAEKVYNVRKERVNYVHSRIDMKKIMLSSLVGRGYKANATYICGTCEKDFSPKGPHIWVVPSRVYNEKKKTMFICDECAEAKVTYRQEYGFWLRGFASEHFIPCEKCQDKLHEMMMTMTVAFYTQECITIETVEANGKIVWQFLLRFLTSNKQVFRPCEECQKKLQKIWETKELHIGNENKPSVELWRKMNQVISELDK